MLIIQGQGWLEMVPLCFSGRFFGPTSDVDISETGCMIYVVLKTFTDSDISTLSFPSYMMSSSEPSLNRVKSGLPIGRDVALQKVRSHLYIHRAAYPLCISTSK